jgi:chaperonin GroES
MELNPLHDRVVIRVTESESRSAGGIVIPDNAKEKPTTGEILAVGPGRITEDGVAVPMSVKKGDRVLIGQHSGQKVKVSGEEVTILREDEILATIE